MVKNLEGKCNRLDKYRRVTDLRTYRQTDGRTDRHLAMHGIVIISPRYAYASSGKN